MNKNLLPPFLVQFNKELEELVKTGQIETKKANDLIEDLYNQCFIDTATWGLDFWEESYNIKKDITKSYEERRSFIKAKIRGQGTTTKKVIEQVAESFIEGTVKAIEHPKEYYFNLNIESIKGFPYKADDLYFAIDEIKPAHLGVYYKFISTTKDKIKFASVLRAAETITVYPWTPKETMVKGKVYIPISNNNDFETTTIYPKGGN